jgi:hypothetical protein
MVQAKNRDCGWAHYMGSRFQLPRTWRRSLLDIGGLSCTIVGGLKLV